MKNLLFTIVLGLLATMSYAGNTKQAEITDNQTSAIATYENPYKFIKEINNYIYINTVTNRLVDCQRDLYGNFPISIYTKDNRYFVGRGDIYYSVYNNDKTTFNGYNVSRYRYTCKKGDNIYFFNM